MLHTRFIKTNSDSAWLLWDLLKQIQIRCDNFGLCSKKTRFGTIVVGFVHTDPDSSWSLWALFRQAQIIYCNCEIYFKKLKTFMVTELTCVMLTVGCVQTDRDLQIYFFSQVVLHSPQ
jgi:hypothetical protein